MVIYVFADVLRAFFALSRFLQYVWHINCAANIEAGKKQLP